MDAIAALKTGKPAPEVWERLGKVARAPTSPVLESALSGATAFFTPETWIAITTAAGAADPVALVRAISAALPTSDPERKLAELVATHHLYELASPPFGVGQWVRQGRRLKLLLETCREPAEYPPEFWRRMVDVTDGLIALQPEMRKGLESVLKGRAGLSPGSLESLARIPQQFAQATSVPAAFRAFADRVSAPGFYEDTPLEGHGSVSQAARTRLPTTLRAQASVLQQSQQPLPLIATVSAAIVSTWEARNDPKPLQFLGRYLQGLQSIELCTQSTAWLDKVKSKLEPYASSESAT